MKTRFGLFFISLLLALLMLSGCSFYNRLTKRNSPERIEKQQQKQFEKEYAKHKKRHREMQSERTLEMFERSKKREKRLNKHRKRSWIRHVLGIGD